MSDILISGYYGFKNSGDDALLLSIIRELKQKKDGIKITVLSKNPQETEHIYKVKAVSRDNIFSLISAVMSCKMLLLGGGTLIQDGTSTKSLIYYLSVIKIAQFFRKKVMLYSNGIGPLKDSNRKITKKILNKVNLITLRDSISKDELIKTGVTKPETVLTADSAFCIECDKKSDISIHKNKWNIPDGKNYFCIAVRNHRKLPHDFCQSLAKVCDYICKNYDCYPVFLPFQKQNDTQITQEIIKNMKSVASVCDTEVDISVLLGIIKESKICIGMRLHSLIYSAICTIPQIGLVYDPKVSGFMNYIGQSLYLDAENLDADELIRAVDGCFKNYDTIKTELTKNLHKMKQLAKKNAELAIKLLEE